MLCIDIRVLRCVVTCSQDIKHVTESADLHAQSSMLEPCLNAPPYPSQTLHTLPVQEEAFAPHLSSSCQALDPDLSRKLTLRQLMSVHAMCMQAPSNILQTPALCCKLAGSCMRLAVLRGRSHCQCRRRCHKQR